ncbi:unnamed protein product [Blepharisma stoltei]|uniref:Uncharacterized protein n=1 Tax=Blepharisma stoltei TaxID=1481888 RepID=A0AAU9JNW4_9CILI|nr:unnamed protein product [Blepharisma stoltei]
MGMSIKIIGGFICSLVILLYSTEIYKRVSNWNSYAEVQEDTVCYEVFFIEIWLIFQNTIWIIVIAISLSLLIIPNNLMVILLALYVLGPFFLFATLICLAITIKFFSCCNDEQDNCIDYFPYKEQSDFLMIMLVSLMFSIAVCYSMIDAMFGLFMFRDYRSSISHMIPMYI